MSDFRDRLGLQLAAAAAGLARGPEGDFRERLGVELSRAARELAGTRVPAAPRRRRRVPWLTRPAAVGLAFAAFAGTAFAAVAIWTPLLGNSQYGYNPGASASAPPQAQLDALGVLRRAQTDADRGALSQTALTYINNYTTGVRTAYVRLLANVGGDSFVLVPVAERDATAATGGAPLSSTPLMDALCVYAQGQDPGLHVEVFCWSLAQIESGAARGIFDTELIGLAPDGATTASLAVAGEQPLTAPVQGNFFAASLPAGPPPIVGADVTFTH